MQPDPQPNLRPGQLVHTCLRIHGMGVALYVLAALLCTSLGLRADSLTYPLSVVATVLVVWSLYSWRATAGSLFNPYGIFLGMAALFNLGQTFPEVLGLNPHGLLEGAFAPSTLVRTLFLSTTCLAGFHLGALVCARYTGGAARMPAAAPTPEDRYALNAVGWGLLAVSFVPSVLLIQQALDVVLTAGYFALYQQEESTGLAGASRVLAGFLVPAAIFLLLGGKDRKLNIGLSFAVVAASFVINLFLGFRAYATMPLIAWAWALDRCVWRIPRVPLVTAAALVLFVVFPLVRATREVSGTERSSATFLVESYFSIDNPVLSILSETGGSMITTAYTVELVPQTRGYEGGLSYWYALTTLFPNLFWKVHPAIASGTPTTWLAWMVDPWLASRGGSIGYSFVAEAYLNFGWVGAPLFLMVLGGALAGLSLWADRSGDWLKVAMAACFLSFLSHYARQDAITIVRPLVWYALGPYVLAILVLRLRRSASAAAPGRSASSPPVEACV